MNHFRLHGNHIGNLGINNLVDGLIDFHESGKKSEEELAAINKKADEVVADVLKESLNGSSPAANDAANGPPNSGLRYV